MELRPIHPRKKREFLLTDGGVISDGESKKRIFGPELNPLPDFRLKTHHTEKHESESRIPR